MLILFYMNNNLETLWIFKTFSFVKNFFSIEMLSDGFIKGQILPAVIG